MARIDQALGRDLSVSVENTLELLVRVFDRCRAQLVEDPPHLSTTNASTLIGLDAAAGTLWVPRFRTRPGRFGLSRIEPPGRTIWPLHRDGKTRQIGTPHVPLHADATLAAVDALGQSLARDDAAQTGLRQPERCRDDDYTRAGTFSLAHERRYIGIGAWHSRRARRWSGLFDMAAPASASHAAHLQS